MDHEPPFLEPTPEPKFGFGLQVSTGIFAVLAVVGICLATHSTRWIQIVCGVAPPAAIVCCLFRRVRGIGVGLFLGIGLSGLALIGLCFATFKI